MPENTPGQQDSSPSEYDPLRQALPRPLQLQLAKQGIHVPPEEALQVSGQNFAGDAERYLQQELAGQGIDVSSEEALNLFMKKLLHGFKLQYRQELVGYGIDATPDEAYAIQKLRIMHLMMEQTGVTDPHDAIEHVVFDGPPKRTSNQLATTCTASGEAATLEVDDEQSE